MATSAPIRGFVPSAYYPMVVVVLLGLVASNSYPNRPLEQAIILSAFGLVQVLLLDREDWRLRAGVATCAVLQWALATWLPDPLLMFMLASVGVLLPARAASVLVPTVLINLTFLLALLSGALHWLVAGYGHDLMSVLPQFARNELLSPLTILGSWPLVTLGLGLLVRGRENRKAKPILKVTLAVATTLVLAIVCLILRSPIPLIVLAAWLAQQGARVEEEAPAVAPARFRRLVPALAFGVLSALLVLTTAPVAVPMPKTVGFTKIGLGKQTSEEGIPNTRQLQLEAEFGRLTRVLASQGMSPRLNVPLTNASLRDVDCLFIINPLDNPTRSELDALYKRIGEGMTLVVAGDHTNISGVALPCNAILAPAGMKLNFDSAIPHSAFQSWHKALWIAPALQGPLRVGNSFEISVGASVAVGPSSTPLVVGSRGYSDRGNVKNPPGFLGDMNFNADEKSNDIVLVAEAAYGSGRVVAFGDTSTFQDGALASSAPAIVRLLTTERLGGMWIAFGLAGLAFAVLLVSASHFTRLAGASIAGSLAVFLLAGHIYASVTATPLRLTGMPVFASDCHSAYPGPFPDQHIDKLGWVYARKGRDLFHAPVRQAMSQRASSIIIAAPLLPVPESLANDLKQYVQGGGALYVFTGHKYEANTRTLLETFSLQLNTIALGGRGSTKVVDKALAATMAKVAKPDELIHSLLFDACEIKGKSEVLLTTMEKPSMVRKRIGKGTLLVCSDARWISDEGIGELLAINTPSARLAYEILQ